MQLRISRSRQNGKLYQYAQIVESYRRAADGMPTHRVLASLGAVTDAQAANLKAAFDANREGRQVQVVDPSVFKKVIPKVAWNLVWLDLAVCLQAWGDSGLRDLVGSLLGGHQDQVEPAAVVAALVLQRCIAPDSKLAACRWFPKTALPELLGVAPAAFHNTRVHRVLERLEAVDEDLQVGLARTLRAAGGEPCSALFIDCTDTWFVGEGPDLAQAGKTKEGLSRRKVGIVLLCNQAGMPLRFHVIEGNTDDGVAMLGLLQGMSAPGWVADVPVVCDRALGNTADLQALAGMHLAFVTALVAQEHAAYGATLNCPELAALNPNDPGCMDKAAAAVCKAGMTRAGADLYILDLGLVQRGAGVREAATEAMAGRHRAPYRGGDDLARAMLAQARAYRQAVDSKQVHSYRALQEGLGISSAELYRFLGMLKLPAKIQEHIDAGVGRNLTRQAIVRLCAGNDPVVHAAAFARECGEARPGRRSAGTPRDKVGDAGSPTVQAVVAFNPEIWQHKRAKAQERATRLLAAVAAQNTRLVADASPAAAAHALAQLLRVQKELHLGDVYTVAIVTSPEGALQIEAVRDEKNWQEIRARDGFNVVVAAPQVELSAEARVRLYRSKDKIEKDFQTIKSVLDLRPVRHRTDAKVRAHVALCVLALAVERWIEHKLARAGRPRTAASTFAELEAVRLCGLQLHETQEVIATVGVATPEQLSLAAALDAAWATQDTAATARLHKVYR